MATKTPVKTTDQDTTATDEPASSLDIVLTAFDKAWDYTNGSWHSRWQDNYKLYNNERIKYGYKGISDTFVPMTFGTVETLCSALFGTKPKFGYVPPSDRQNQDTTILNALVDYYWDKDQWSLKVINTGRGMFREGTAVDYLCWESDHPRLINIPIRDFFIDPNAFELSEKSTKYCGRRYLTTLDDLQSYEIVDLTKVDSDGNPTGDMKKKYTNLDKLKGEDLENPVTGSTQYQDQTTDKEEKDMYYGSTIAEPDANQVEVIEYWSMDKTISVANRTVVIEDVDNYFKTADEAAGAEFPEGLLPFMDARDYVDGSLFYAKGEVDFIADQQEDLNDFSNQMKDAVSNNLNQMKTLHPKYAHMLKEIQNLPGAVYPIEPNMLIPIPNGQIPVEAFNERMNIKAEIRETTASNEVIKGAAETGKGNQTATEINAQIQGAGQRISLKVTQLENGYFHRMAKIVFRMTQLYVTEPMMVQIMGKDGASWQQFNPEEFKGQYEPRVQLDISIQSQKQEQATNAANLLKAFLNDPNVNQMELTKLVLAKGFDLEPDEVSALMTPNPAPAAPAAMPGQPPAGASSDPMAALLAAAQGGQAAPPETGPSPTDIVAHPQTGQPVMAGEVQ